MDSYSSTNIFANFGASTASGTSSGISRHLTPSEQAYAGGSLRGGDSSLNLAVMPNVIDVGLPTNVEGSTHTLAQLQEEGPLKKRTRGKGKKPASFPRKEKAKTTEGIEEKEGDAMQVVGNEEDLSAMPLLNEKGKPLKTSKRATQNRSSQRAFRQRKDIYLRELEEKSARLEALITKQGPSMSVPSDTSLDLVSGSSAVASTSAVPMEVSSSSRLDGENSLIITSVATSGPSATSSTSSQPSAVLNSGSLPLDPQLRRFPSTLDPSAIPSHLSQPELLRLWNEERKSWAIEQESWVNKEMIHNREKLEWSREREALKAIIKVDVNDVEFLENYLKGLRGQGI